MGAAKEYLGSIVNEMFVKKESNVKRFLPSIKNMKIVSFHLDPSTTTEPSRWQLALCFTKRPWSSFNFTSLIKSKLFEFHANFRDYSCWVCHQHTSRGETHQQVRFGSDLLWQISKNSRKKIEKKNLCVLIMLHALLCRDMCDVREVSEATDPPDFCLQSRAFVVNVRTPSVWQLYRRR